MSTGQKITIKINAEAYYEFQMAAKKCLLCFRGSVLLPRPLLLLIHMGKNCKYVCTARKALVYRIVEVWCGMKGWGTRLQPAAAPREKKQF